MPRFLTLLALFAVLAGCSASPEPAGPAIVEKLPTTVVAEPTPTVAINHMLPTAEPSPPPAAPAAPPPDLPPGPPRVGLQVGHWKSDEMPEELSRHRSSTGAVSGVYTELELNLAIAELVRVRLEAAGVQVDVLPATIPAGYQADAFVAIHADGSTSPGASGWKLSTAWRASPASRLLASAMEESYGTIGLPYDPLVTANMRGYYAFNSRRHVHAVSSTTPAIILEMGFVTSPVDREVLYGQQDLVADAVAQGILAYLAQHPAPGDPQAETLLRVPTFPAVRTTDPISAHAEPGDDTTIIAELPAGQRLFPFEERAGWYHVPLPPSYQRTAWIRVDQVEATQTPRLDGTQPEATQTPRPNTE